MPCTDLLGDCFSNTNATLDNEIRLQNVLEQLTAAVSTYQNVVSEIKRNIQTSEQGKTRNFFEKKLFDASAFLDQIMQTKAELDDLVTFTGAGHLRQRLRVCQDSEGYFQIGLLLGLIALVEIAVYSTYKLHERAEYDVKLDVKIYKYKLAILGYARFTEKGNDRLCF